MAHQAEPYFEDAMAALQRQRAGDYTSDEELGGLYERAGRVLMQHGEEHGPIADALRASGRTRMPSAWARAVLDFLGSG